VSASKAKGTRGETAIVRFLRDHGFSYAERRALNGARDLGDITGIPGGPVIECKNQNRHSLAEWIDEANAEAANARAPFGLVWFKRRGKTDPGDWFVLLDGSSLVLLLREAGYGPPPTPEPEAVPGQLDLGAA
jgi:hypothetical protein